MLKAIRRGVSSVWYWRDGFLRDACLTLVEAASVFVISQIPFLLLAIQYVIATKDAVFNLDTIIIVISNNVRPGEVLAYIASLLASTMVYFVVRPRLFKSKTLIAIFCTLCPLLAIWLATPTFMADRYKQVGNPAFMTSYALFLLAISSVVWIFAMFHQRRIESTTPLISGNQPAADIIKQVSGEG